MLKGMGMRRHLVLAVFALTACSGGVSEADRQKMLKSCEQRGESDTPGFQNACFCAVDYLVEQGIGPDDVDEGSFARAFNECGFPLP